jgi:hypothetical protein
MWALLKLTVFGVLWMIAIFIAFGVASLLLYYGAGVAHAGWNAGH